MTACVVYLCGSFSLCFLATLFTFVMADLKTVKELFYIITTWYRMLVLKNHLHSHYLSYEPYQYILRNTPKDFINCTQLHIQIPLNLCLLHQKDLIDSLNYVSFDLSQTHSTSHLFIELATWGALARQKHSYISLSE